MLNEFLTSKIMFYFTDLGLSIQFEIGKWNVLYLCSIFNIRFQITLFYISCHHQGQALEFLMPLEYEPQA